MKGYGKGRPDTPYQPPDMTPPPMRTWAVVVDSPELSQKIDCEVEARGEAEAQVNAAEVALAVLSEERLSAKFRRRKRETQVAAVAKYAVATAKP